MRYSIECNNCGMQLNIKNFDYPVEDLKGTGVKVQSFTCPKCDERYIVAVFDRESDRLRDEFKALDSDFSELRLMDNGPSKDERARVLTKERARVKKAMVTHNSRLKAQYLKELKRSAKRK